MPIVRVSRSLGRAALALAAAAAPALAQRPPYTVAGAVILSEMQPSIRLTLDTTLTYVGSQRRVLPASDGAYARRMLRAHGLTLPPQMLYERFIYLPDTTGRRELMVIYAEDAKSRDTLGVPRATLDSLLANHERRALRSFAISESP